MTPLPAPVQRAVAVWSKGTIYVAGGLSSAGQSVGGVFALDPATGNLSSLGSVPQAFHHAGQHMAWVGNIGPAIEIEEDEQDLARGARHPGRKLQGAGNLWRVRVGDYRIVYAIDDDGQTVDVRIVAHRREVYRDM